MWSVWIKARHHHDLPRQIPHKARRAKDRLTQSAEALHSELKGGLGAPTRVCKRTPCKSQGPGIAKPWKPNDQKLSCMAAIWLLEPSSLGKWQRLKNDPEQWGGMQLLWLNPKLRRLTRHTCLPSWTQEFGVIRTSIILLYPCSPVILRGAVRPWRGRRTSSGDDC